MQAESRTLRGTVVGVTGATSGIGRATARALVDAGAKVALTGRRQDRLANIPSEFDYESVVWAAGDIADPATSKSLVGAALTKSGTMDSLVAAAGQGIYGGIESGSDDEMRDMMDTNFAGTVWSVRAAIPAFRAVGGGDVVIVSSAAAIRGGGNEAIYAGTKAAQLGFAGAVDRELRQSGIRVTTMCPAAVKTEFAIGRGRTEGAEWLEDVLRPEDVAGSILYALQLPRRIRATQIDLWSAVQGS